MFRLRLPASIRSEAWIGLDACNGPERAPAGVRLSIWEWRAVSVPANEARDRTGAEAILFELDPECTEAGRQGKLKPPRAGRTLKAVEEERQ